MAFNYETGKSRAEKSPPLPSADSGRHCGMEQKKKQEKERKSEREREGGVAIKSNEDASASEGPLSSAMAAATDSPS